MGYPQLVVFNNADNDQVDIKEMIINNQIIISKANGDILTLTEGVDFHVVSLDTIKLMGPGIRTNHAKTKHRLWN